MSLENCDHVVDLFSSSFVIQLFDKWSRRCESVRACVPSVVIVTVEHKCCEAMLGWHLFFSFRLCNSGTENQSQLCLYTDSFKRAASLGCSLQGVYRNRLCSDPVIRAQSRVPLPPITGFPLVFLLVWWDRCPALYMCGGKCVCEGCCGPLEQLDIWVTSERRLRERPWGWEGCCWERTRGQSAGQSGKERGR